MADSTYKDSDNSTFSATTGQKLDPNTLMKKRMFEALARTMVKPGESESEPKPVSKDPVNVQVKKSRPEYVYGVKKAKQKIEKEISECGLFLKEKADFEEKPEKETETSDEQKQSNYPSTWSWAKPKPEFKEPEPEFKEPKPPKQKKTEPSPIREEATGPLPLSSYKPKKAKVPYRGSKDLPSKSQVDAEQAGEESWKDRYIQSKKVQKVVKESGLINKAKKSFKSKNAPEASTTPEVNVFPGTSAKDMKAEALRRKEEIRNRQNLWVDGSLEEYSKLAQSSSGAAATVEKVESSDSSDEEDGGLWDTIMGKN